MMLAEYLVYQLPKRSFCREFDEVMLGERIEPHTALTCQFMLSGTDCNKRVLHKGKNLKTGPAFLACDCIKAEIDVTGAHHCGNRLQLQGSNRKFNFEIG